MSSTKPASAAGALTLFARGLGIAALACTAGCSSDVSRFDLLDFSGPGSAQAAAGYQPRTPGTGIKESSLPPVQETKDTRLARDYGVARPDYGPSPWKWADRPPPKAAGDQPLWTDEEPFPWPDGKQRPVERKSSFQGHYTMKRGDTLPAVADRYKVNLDELKRVNGISDPSRVKIGTVLAIPERAGAGAAPSAQMPPRVVQVKPLTAPPPVAAKAAAEPAAPVQKMVAKQSGSASDALPQPEVAGGKFRWPARGKVIASFGAMPDGSKSEGVKLAVPMGTDIHAAEAGRVHYAGDGIKGYGNLILIRHANGWVSTYAHAERMLVKVGDEVKRGQVIGKVGRSGPVAQPQLGFELRKGSTPVDPLAHLTN
jgi:murein DD-endopeptidase MepM/ murein hydrolase activator NlpD